MTTTAKSRPPVGLYDPEQAATRWRLLACVPFLDCPVEIVWTRRGAEGQAGEETASVANTGEVVLLAIDERRGPIVADQQADGELGAARRLCAWSDVITVTPAGGEAPGA